ncbi:glycosyltransferase family 4 protein [Nafulsella turpanensis]|uniref:glycosyltransferase family 4 protein n=1 Tax=Nafulsella turpanensis TaxID=1265690 RepID=UPI00035E4FED|nr:glycosyltransferase family 4 protein [Nafulsella turpanensis]
MMNLLFLTYQGDMAGSTNSIAYLTQGLAERGHQVYIGCRKESLLYGMLENSRVHLIPMEFKGKLDRQNMRQIRDAVRRYNIQIINAQSSKDRYTSIFARWLYRLPVKIVHTRRQNPESIGGWLQNTFYVKGTDKIVVISDGLKNTFIKKGIPAEHLEVLYNGMHPMRFKLHQPERTELLRKNFKLAPSSQVIGFVGRKKNQEQLLEALAYLPEEVIVLFVGIEEKDLLPYLQKITPRQRIIFAGQVPPDDVINFYPLFNVNVLASTMDGFGLVLLEAMGMGVPVIGTDFPGINDVIQDGQSGLLFEDGNARDLAEKINRVLNDEALMIKLITNGKERALKTFSIENTIQAYEQFFSRLIQQGV